jgi:uncharacterized protein involved in oxidation of intracellular sulfur
MQLAIIVNTSDPESAWNALRLGNEALGAGNRVSMFLLGVGVEITNIRDNTFDVAGALKKFIDRGGNLLACGTCLELRHQEAGICPISTMSELVELISDSDKVVTLG